MAYKGGSGYGSEGATGAVQLVNVPLDTAARQQLVPCYKIRVTLIENFASRRTVKEKLNDRWIAEPPIGENSKKIRELTEAMRAEQDARIRNRMMAVRGILAGYPTKDAASFADVDRRTIQLWVARFDEGGIGGLRDAPGRGRPPRAGYGRIRKLADRLGG